MRRSRSMLKRRVVFPMLCGGAVDVWHSRRWKAPCRSHVKTDSDLLVSNKIDLAPNVGAALGVMRADTKRMRGARPFVLTNLKTKAGPGEVITFIERKRMPAA